MKTNEKTNDSDPKSGSDLSSNALSGWIDANRKPLADVKNGEYVLFSGNEKQRLFAIQLRSGAWEYHAGSIQDDGTIVNNDGDDVGRVIEDVDFYLNISEPNTQDMKRKASS